MTTVSQVNPIKVYFNPSEQQYMAWVQKHGPHQPAEPSATRATEEDLRAHPRRRLGVPAPREGRISPAGEVDVKTGTIHARRRSSRTPATCSGQASTARCASPWT